MTQNKGLNAWTDGYEGHSRCCCDITALQSFIFHDHGPFVLGFPDERHRPSARPIAVVDSVDNSEKFMAGREAPVGLRDEGHWNRGNEAHGQPVVGPVRMPTFSGTP